MTLTRSRYKICKWARQQWPSESGKLRDVSGKSTQEVWYLASDRSSKPFSIYIWTISCQFANKSLKLILCAWSKTLNSCRTSQSKTFLSCLLFFAYQWRLAPMRMPHFRTTNPKLICGQCPSFLWMIYLNHFIICMPMDLLYFLHTCSLNNDQIEWKKNSIEQKIKKKFPFFSKLL